MAEELEKTNEVQEGPWIAGPWTSDFVQEDNEFLVVAPDGLKRPWNVATIHGFCGMDNREKANTKLICAAPDMAQAMIKFCRRVEAGEVQSVNTYNEFKAILAEAGYEL